MLNLYESKTHLSKLIERAVAGEDIVIAKAGKPMVRLVPWVEKPVKHRRSGRLAGKIHIAEDFDDPLPREIQDAFEGKGT